MCECHRLVCEEHVTHLRPFEEICVGMLRGTCQLCGKELTNADKYTWLPIELFKVLQDEKQ
jgi:hypothetical protein